MHTEQSPLAGQSVVITQGEFRGEIYRVEDWWDRVSGKSWMVSFGNPACIEYAVRSSAEDLPIDDEVLYGKVGPFGKLIHAQQIK